MQHYNLSACTPGSRKQLSFVYYLSTPSNQTSILDSGRSSGCQKKQKLASYIVKVAIVTNVCMRLNLKIARTPQFPVL